VTATSLGGPVGFDRRARSSGAASYRCLTKS